MSLIFPGASLADGHPALPSELAALVYLESVAFIDKLRAECLAQGENVVIEGTLTWPPAARRLLGELVKREYREVVILDVEVPRELAHEQALDRWWHGRQERIAGHGQGGRFVPATTIDHAFTATDRHSVCAANVRAAFDSEAAHALPVLTLRVLNSTGPTPVVETHERRSGGAANRGLGRSSRRWTPTPRSPRRSSLVIHSRAAR